MTRDRPTRRSNEPSAWTRSQVLPTQWWDGFIFMVADTTRPSNNYKKHSNWTQARVQLGHFLGGRSHASRCMSPPSPLSESCVRFSRVLAPLLFSDKSTPQLDTGGESPENPGSVTRALEAAIRITVWSRPD